MVFGRRMQSRTPSGPKVSSIEDAASLAPGELARISADVGRAVLGRKKHKLVRRTKLIDALAEQGTVPQGVPERQNIGKYVLTRLEELNRAPIGTYDDAVRLYKVAIDYRDIKYQLVRT